MYVCKDSSHPYKQETRGLDIIQATSFFPWWLLLSFFKNILKNWICKTSWNILTNPEKSEALFHSTSGFMQLLGTTFLLKFSNQIFNRHLNPSYGPVSQAFLTWPKQNIQSLRRILQARIVYLIIPRVTAFASFHTTRSKKNNVPWEYTHYIHQKSC